MYVNRLSYSGLSGVYLYSWSGNAFFLRFLLVNHVFCRIGVIKSVLVVKGLAKVLNIPFNYCWYPLISFKLQYANINLKIS